MSSGVKTLYPNRKKHEEIDSMSERHFQNLIRISFFMLLLLLCMPGKNKKGI
jgi:hypothetical protein